MANQSNSKKRVEFTNDNEVREDKSRKKGRVWMYSALVLATPAAKYTQPTPLNVDNDLPGVELWFGTKEENEICFVYHLDSCAAMNIRNLRVHQWLMTQYPSIVAEYIQYDNAHSFQPLQLQCTVNDLVNAESIHGKLTVIARYWMRYDQGNKKSVLSFGLDADVAVNSLIGLPTLQKWSGLFDFGNGNFLPAVLIQNSHCVMNQLKMDCQQM